MVETKKKGLSKKYKIAEAYKSQIFLSFPNKIVKLPCVWTCHFSGMRLGQTPASISVFVHD